MKIYTKESLIQSLNEIKNLGWILNQRENNHGCIGNTLEDLLGIRENNLPLPNASEWELKTQRKGTTALVTLFHDEPSPKALRIVPSILLPKYGWRHKEAGQRHPETEKSFRQTINARERSDRGFKVVVNKVDRKIEISFDAEKVSKKHVEWLSSVEKLIGLGELNPKPYWGFDDLFHCAGTKLHNCFLVEARTKRFGDKAKIKYEDIYILKNFGMEKFINGLEQGFIYVDFDARSGHNHGTKFRLRINHLKDLYEEVIHVS